MCPHGYHHSGCMATPALGTRDVQVDLVGNWLLYGLSEEMSSNLTRFLNLFDNFFSGLTRIRTHAQVVHASWCCLARRAC